MHKEIAKNIPGEGCGRGAGFLLGGLSLPRFFFCLLIFNGLWSKNAVFKIRKHWVTRKDFCSSYVEGT